MRNHSYHFVFLAAAVLSCSQSKAEQPIRLPGHSGGISSLTFSYDSKLLVSTAPDSVKVWDVATRKALLSYNSGESHNYNCATFSPDGAHLAVYGGEYLRRPNVDGYVIILFDTATWKKKQSFDLPTYHGNQHRSDIIFTPDGRRLIWGGWHGPSNNNLYSYFISDVETGQVVNELPLNRKSSGRPFALTPDGKRLVHGELASATINGDNWQGVSDILIWEIGDAKESTRRAQVPGSILDLKLSPSGDRLAVAGGSDTRSNRPGILSIYDLDNSSAEPLSLEGHRGYVVSVAFSPSGRLLAAGGADRIIRLWNVHTGKVVREFRDHPTRVVSVAMSPDGKWLASGGEQGEAAIRLWPLNDDLVEMAANDR